MKNTPYYLEQLVVSKLRQYLESDNLEAIALFKRRGENWEVEIKGIKKKNGEIKTIDFEEVR